MTSTSSSQRLASEVQPGWAAILGFLVLTALLMLAREGKILNLAFPAGSALVGGFLYFRYPILFNGFSWWIWFLSAYVRRIADFHSGYTDPSPILLAPHLAMGFTLITVWRYLPIAHRQNGLAFILAAIGVVYGFLVALVNSPDVTDLISFLDWVIPIAYGFHLLIHWRDYPSYRQNLQKAFTWGLIVMGAYGVYQYLVAPAWDVNWLNNSGMITANGYHDAAGVGPRAIRVFSTMQSVEPFGAVVTGALLMLLSIKSPIQFPASALGYLALLLTMMRSAWIGWFAGLLTLFGSLTSRFQVRLILTFTVMLLCCLPLATLDQFSNSIAPRLQTLANVQEDGSAKGRKEEFSRSIDAALMSGIGEGISRKSADNSLLVMLFQLGWLGTVPYFGGMLLLLCQLFGTRAGRSDPFIGTVRAIVVSSVSRLLVNNLTYGASSVLLWGFLGIGLAAVQHHQNLYSLEEDYNDDITES